MNFLLELDYLQYCQNNRGMCFRNSIHTNIIHEYMFELNDFGKFTKHNDCLQLCLSIQMEHAASLTGQSRMFSSAMMPSIAVRTHSIIVFACFKLSKGVSSLSEESPLLPPVSSLSTDNFDILESDSILSFS